MKSHFLYIFIIVLVLLAGCNRGPEPPEDCPPHMPRRGHMGKHPGPFFGDAQDMQRDLDLTDKQIAEIQTINDHFQNQHSSNRERMDPHVETLRSLLSKDDIDYNEVRQVLSRLAEIDIDRQILMIKQRIEIEKVLTQEQIRKMRRKRPR